MLNKKSPECLIRVVLLTMVGSITLAGCTNGFNYIGVQKRDGQLPVVTGPPVTDNNTPLSAALRCLSDKIKGKTNDRAAVTVGRVTDLTGKFSEADGGALITQGGSLMAISALGKLDDAVVLRERFDTSITDQELAYVNNRQLGDGRRHSVGEQSVPWLPYTGGSILKTDVFIVGGITELNFNIHSGGFGAEIDGVGGRGRTFTVNVGVDLRIVNSSNLNVLKVVSLQKQVVGYEVEAGIFSFFDSRLFDVSGGEKNQEPLQLAVRSVIESGVLELVAHIYGIDHKECLPDVFVAPQVMSHDPISESARK